MADKSKDPGAYIGHEPELSSETIPGGVRPDDERVAGEATQSGGDAAEERLHSGALPGGHRQGSRASDDDVRQARETG